MAAVEFRFERRERERPPFGQSTFQFQGWISCARASITRKWINGDKISLMWL